MQYREELALAVENVYSGIESRRSKVLEQIQKHAVDQIKEGYTGFRVSKLKKSEERYLKEWAEMTNARVDVIKFRCFENSKRYIIRQFIVDLKGSMELEYELEGNTLVIE